MKLGERGLFHTAELIEKTEPEQSKASCEVKCNCVKMMML